MATNLAVTSGTKGFLRPATGPLNETDTLKLIHGFIVGVTGINGKNVRPRWQPEPSQMPSFETDWCAFGIARKMADPSSYQDPQADGLESSRDEVLQVLHSFYGPNCNDLCDAYIASIDVEQNRAMLQPHLVIRETQDPIVLPALLKEKWVKRIDVTVIFARRAVRKYPVNIIESAQMGLDNESYLTSIQTPSN